MVIQGPTAKRLWLSVVFGLIFFLGLLLEENWVTALVVGLLYGLGQFFLSRYLHRGDDDQSDQ